MKKILALLLALVMLVGTLAGCTGEPQSGDPVGSQTQAPTTTDGSGAPEPTQDQTDAAYVDAYKSTFSESITSMNPYCTTGTTDYVFIANIIEGLVETDKYGRSVPCMAESWEAN